MNIHPLGRFLNLPLGRFSTSSPSVDFLSSSPYKGAIGRVFSKKQLPKKPFLKACWLFFSFSSYMIFPTISFKLILIFQPAGTISHIFYFTMLILAFYHFIFFSLSIFYRAAISWTSCPQAALESSPDTRVTWVNSLSLLRILNMPCPHVLFEQPKTQEGSFFLELPNDTEVLGCCSYQWILKSNIDYYYC